MDDSNPERDYGEDALWIGQDNQEFSSHGERKMRYGSGEGEMKKNRWFLGIVFGVVGVAIICIAVTTLAYLRFRTRSFHDRPLVLIHSPFNRERVETGDGVLIHASARLEDGINQLELWVDDTLIASRDVSDDPPTNLVLTADWIPNLASRHVLVARAISSHGTEGRSSIVVDVIESEEVDVTYEVQEGDTLESIAEEHGVTPDELVDSNPEAGGGIAPGDTLTLPDEEDVFSGGEPALDESGDPPDDEGAAPGSGGALSDFMGTVALMNLSVLGEEPGEPTNLRVEILSLDTGVAYEGLHCYIGLGTGSPQWYPDADYDQSTDESFTSLGDGTWAVGEQLTGEGAPSIFWPRNEPLPFEITCVAITGVGTDALELGQSTLTIPPEEWDGTPHNLEVSGEGGSYRAAYRIEREFGSPDAVPLFLDPDMTPPVNARIDDRRISLRWDYEPEPEEESIDGFRVYLNGNLQWVEPPDARESGLPYEWFHPPCGVTYTFAVTAYRIGFPDGPESYPAIALINTPEEGCSREIFITFDTLETFDLGGDGSHEDRHGDVGPVYGYFYANEQQIHFDARPSGGRGGSLDMPNGLSHYTVYDIPTMWTDPSWNFSGMPRTFVDVPFGGTFEFGFHIMDQDTGRCRDSDDRGCDDLVCEGFSEVYEDEYDTLDRMHGGTITSEDGRCRLHYTFSPVSGSPVGSEEPGREPLPWIHVDHFDIDEETGAVQIHVRNTGTATWPWRDLDVALQTREGETIGVYTWEDFVLETGDWEILTKPEMAVGYPRDACVVIDPDDEVLEYYERDGIMVHHPICLQRPDLVINDVRYDSFGGGRVRVTVENVADVPLSGHTVALETRLPDGSPAYLAASWPDVELEPYATRVFDLIGVSEMMRETLRDGYTVVVNPDQTLAEINYDNNSYEVAGTANLVLYWCHKNVPRVGDSFTSTARMYFTADVVSGGGTRQVLETRWQHHLNFQETAWEYDHDEDGFAGYWFSCSQASDAFEIFGDEWLRIGLRVTYRHGEVGDYVDYGSLTREHGPSWRWGSGSIDAVDGNWSDCSHDGGDHLVSQDFIGGLSTYTWVTRYLVCEITP
jgi:LysM repeat protein